jgi:chemotaxis protein MotB
MNIKTIWILLVAVFITSCVSSNRYEEALAEKKQLEEEVLRLEKIENQYADLKSETKNLKSDCERVREELEVSQRKYENMNAARKDLQEVYDKIVQQNKDLLQTSSSEKKELLEELSRKREEMDRREKDLNQMENELAKKEDRMEEMESKLAKKEDRINELDLQLQSMNASMRSTLGKIENALIDFKKDELTVRQENGRVYVSLSQELLFEKGSSTIGARGKEALKQLAQSLKDMNDLSFTVEGHTDSDGSVERNWELSTERATEVVLFLQENGVNPERMIASGKAFYQPVAPNTDEKNKRLNRRTEIIINPNLEQVFDLLRSPKEPQTE